VGFGVRKYVNIDMGGRAGGFERQTQEGKRHVDIFRCGLWAGEWAFVAQRGDIGGGVVGAQARHKREIRF